MWFLPRILYCLTSDFFNYLLANIWDVYGFKKRMTTKMDQNKSDPIKFITFFRKLSEKAIRYIHNATLLYSF